MKNNEQEKEHENIIFHKQHIIQNDKTYNLKIYIRFLAIIFELESLDKNYSNSFSFRDLLKISKYFLQDDEQEDIYTAFSDLKDLLNGDISINEESTSVNFIIYFKKKEIKFVLIWNKEVNINYNSLSNQMKSLIDSNELILGIDLGTTYSSASIILDDKIIVIENSLGKRTTPSFVLFLYEKEEKKEEEKNKVCVGELAKLQPSYKKNIIYNSKRLIGKNINDIEIQSIKQNLAFEIKEDNAYNLLKIKVNEDEYYPDQISGMILKKIVSDSEYHLSKLIWKTIKIKNSVITAPAYFNHKQRKAILNAANIINLNVKRIINEPTAASLAYLYKNLANIEKNIIVFDFGGGTFDITLLYLKQSEYGSYCDIQCTGGDPNFGGEDFDDILMQKCIESIKNVKNENNIDFDLDKKLFQNIRLKRACENAKIKLSKLDETRIFLEEHLPSVGIDFISTREKFEEYCQPLFEKFETIIDNFLRDNKVDKSNISEVIPIGGFNPYSQNKRYT